MMKQNAIVQRSRWYRRLLFFVAVGAWLGGTAHAFGAIDPIASRILALDHIMQRVVPRQNSIRDQLLATPPVLTVKSSG